MSERTLGPGDPMPDLTLLDSEGRAVRLRDLASERALVVYFYPKDETAGCTVQACRFRDLHEEFAAAGARVVGISADPPESHRRFAAHHGLPFLLLSDEDGAAARAFGVRRALFGLLPGRVTFVVDRQGVVRLVFDSMTRVHEHVRRALEMVRSWSGEQSRA